MQHNVDCHAHDNAHAQPCKVQHESAKKLLPLPQNTKLCSKLPKNKKKKEAEEKQLKFWMSPTPPACTPRSTAIQIMKIQKQNCTKLDWKQQPLPLPLPPPPFSVCLSSSLVHPGLARGIIIKCCHKVFPVFHLLLQHRKTKNVMENKIRRPAPPPLLLPPTRQTITTTFQIKLYPIFILGILKLPRLPEDRATNYRWQRVNAFSSHFHIFLVPFSRSENCLCPS